MQTGDKDTLLLLGDWYALQALHLAQPMEQSSGGTCIGSMRCITSKNPSLSNDISQLLIAYLRIPVTWTLGFLGTYVWITWKSENFHNIPHKLDKLAKK